MRSLRAVASLSAAGAVALSAVLLSAGPAAATGHVYGVGAPNAIKDSYIVTLKDGPVRTNGVSALVSTLAAKSGATVRHVYGTAVHGFAGTMTAEAAARLAADPSVQRVEQDGRVTIAGTQAPTPSWGLDRIDQRNLPLNSSYTYPNTGAGVRAYVIDTGIRTSHVDFGGRATWGVNEVGDGNNTDCNGHGTHVSGTVGGASYGVAKGVSLTAVKVLDCSGNGSWASVIAGVDWVTADHVSGPAVANMSLGGTGTNATLEQAVTNSIADGVVYAIASGNSYGADACNFTPARTPNAITVNATSSNDARASFSNIGACTDIFAPGDGITSAWNTSDTATNTISGTSMATPHVTGAAALILAASPSSTPAQVTATMLANATPNVVTDPGAGSPNRLLYVGGGTQPPAAADNLVRGQTLTAGQQLVSQNGAYKLVMQGDGNLVEYTAAGGVLWHTVTYGHPGSWLVFQGDGNVVLYAPGNVPLWHTHSNGTAASLFIIQNDANVVLYGPAYQVYWHRF